MKHQPFHVEHKVAILLLNNEMRNGMYNYKAEFVSKFKRIDYIPKAIQGRSTTMREYNIRFDTFSIC